MRWTFHSPSPRSFLWSLPVLGALAYIAISRASGEPPIVPFLLLAGGVILASFGGSLVGGFAGLLVAAFVVHSTATSFGPTSLTGGLGQALVGSAIYMLTGFSLGRVHDDNEQLLGELTTGHNRLEEMVAARTSELRRVNEDLITQMSQREEMRVALSALEEKVNHTQRLESLGVLAGGIAHDFNNLLTSILGNASVVRAAPSNHDVDVHVAAIERASERAAELCQHILLYAGEREARRLPFSASALLAETIGFVSSSTATRVRFEFDDPDEVSIIADESQIGQVMLNLLTNGADAIEGEGLVTASLRVGDLGSDAISDFLMHEHLTSGPHVWLEVDDNGDGIPADEIKKIFDPFYSTKVEGRGLGLAVVFGVARAHNGGLRVRSEVGSGTTVTFVFPFVDGMGQTNVPDQATHHTPENSIGEATATSTRIIILADDEPTIRELAVGVLEADGWSVIEATNGRAAVEVFQANSGAAIALLDLTMPVMDGLEATRVLAEMDPKLPVVLMSGYRRDFTGLPDQVGFLQKPFRAADLRAIVDRYARHT